MPKDTEFERTSGCEQKGDRDDKDPPNTVPDDVDSVCNKGVRDECRRDVEDVLGDFRRRTDNAVEVVGPIWLATLRDEALMRSLYIYSQMLRVKRYSM